MKKSSIELRPSRKNDTMRFRVRETVEKQKDVPYDQVVFLIRRKVIFRLTEVQENFNF